MKNLIKFVAALAAVLSFTACQKEIDGSKEEPVVTHKVTFVAGTPETKTSATVDGSVVNYSWKSTDEQENGTPEKFHVYENGVEATSIEAVLDDDDVMMISAEFAGPEVQNPAYTCHFNSGVRAVQALDSDGEYDQLSDVLVAKENDPEAGDKSMFTFSFRREIAVAEATLKNLAAGEKVSNIRIESTDGTVLAANYDISEKAFSTTGSTSIELNGLALTIDPSEHTASFRFITVPVADAMLKVSVTTIDGEGKIAGKYVKEFSKAITFNRGNLKRFNVALENDYLDPHINDEGWFRVEDARALNAGDVIRIGRPQHEVVAGAYAENKYFSKVEAEYSVSGDELKRLNIEKGAIDLTLGGSTDAWTIANGSTYYTPSSDIKTATEDPTTWKIQIAASTADAPYVATITDGNNTIKYNASSPRFKTYASGQMDVYVYKKYGNPTDKGLRAECDVEFQIDGAKVEAAEVTMGSDHNVFPEVYTTSTGAKTFSSDNQEVATVDAEGNVTLVSDGTAKIKVEIAETEDTKAGSAEYTMTVNPEPVGDLLNRAWTGIADKTTSYSDWSGKTGSFSGNTYAGNSAGSNNSIQLRASSSTQAKSGIVVTTSASSKVARTVEVSWNTNTITQRSLKIFGKNTAYESPADLYGDAKGTELGTIGRSETTLEITGDYEYIGILAVGGALYLDNIQITWEAAKPAREGLGFYFGVTKVTEPLSATVGDSFTAPVLKDNNGAIDGATYTSSATDVADFVNGVLTLKKIGTTTIKATVPATAEYAAGEATYTLNVGNKLASIAMADGTAQKTTYYVGDEFSFAGIKVTATYNDGTTKTLTDADLTAANFSGFNSETPVAEQAITVTYTENDIPAECQYNVEIRERVTLYDITLPAAVNGNTVTVKGGATQAPAGETVTLVVTPATANGYYLTSLNVNGGDELYTESIKLGGEVAFTMPAGAATVTASFSNLYTVTLTQPAENGTVKVAGTTTASQTFAYGANVTVTAEPVDGYELDEWTVTGTTLADASAASTSFTMPKNAVSVTASFKEESKSKTVVLTTADYTWKASNNQVSQVVDGVTFNFKGGSTEPTYYNDGLRTYENCVITISSSLTITAMTFTYTISNSGSLSTETGTWNASKKEWSGSAKSVVFTVGHSSGTKNGQVRITEISVTIDGGSAPAVIPVTSVTLNKAATSLSVGGTETLTATVNPDNATNKNITWTTSVAGVVTVDGGKITAVSAGSAVIRATSAEDATKYAECTVTVTEGASGYILSEVVSGTTYYMKTDCSSTTTKSEAGEFFWEITDGSKGVLYYINNGTKYYISHQTSGKTNIVNNSTVPTGNNLWTITEDKSNKTVTFRSNAQTTRYLGTTNNGFKAYAATHTLTYEQKQ